MPRIDPQQLLACLGVLLTSSGGILSSKEVQRLASLMTKFSKKLVSKCVYVLILKNTEIPLLGAFMVEGGWNLVHVWLQDGYNNKNWALVSELLELLLMSPTDVEQLKMNNLPKLVKNLSKRDDLEKVKELASQLVKKWLKIVKDDQIQKLSIVNKVDQTHLHTPTSATATEVLELAEIPHVQVEQGNEKDNLEINEQELNTSNNSNSKSCYKIALRDGKHVLCKLPAVESDVTVVHDAVIEDVTPEQEKETEVNSTTTLENIEKADKDLEPEEPKEKKEIDKKKEKSNHDRHKQKSSSSSSKSNSSSSKSSRDKDKSSKDRIRDKERSRSKDTSSKDRSKEKSSQDKDKHRNNGALKSSSSKSSSSKDKDKDKDKKESKEKQAEKDKDTLAKIQPPSIQKIGRIPKKSSDEKKDERKDDAKKPTFSIEIRKNNEEKPKTVKVFNAKMRSTGLLEEAKPPPPRTTKKPTTMLPPVPPKRPSPIRDLIPPPEKKSKLEPSERPGSIKLIPPKPKPPVLQESDIFMDALTASATAKKEPKKRKRRASVSKDSQSSPPTSPSVTTISTAPTNSSIALKNITPPKFYQDTLETEAEEAKEKSEENLPEEKEIVEEGPRTPTDTEEKMEIGDNKESNGLKGVLVHTKRKGPKKSIRWKPEEELVEIQYFELDETERVNVTKTFMDMAKMEVSGEREALQMSRKLQNADVMDARTSWKLLIELDLKPPLAEPGCKSLEKDIQFAREKTTISLPPLIHGRYSESPAEPDLENHQMTDPVSIPLDDPENSEDLPPQPWPEPKGSPPQVNVPNMPSIFPNIQTPFPNYGINGPPPPPPPFQPIPFGAPGFMPPNIMGGNNGNNEWNNMNNGQMMPPIPPDMMNQGPPNMYGPNHENYNQNDNFPPFNQPIFPPNNFNMRGGRGGFRRAGGNGPWVRMNGPGPGGWNQRGGGMNRGGRFCKNIKNHGYCRNRDNCPFIHPN